MATLLVVNPFASGVTPRLVDEVAAVLRPPVDVVLTSARHHATELVRERGPGMEAIAVFSGDGTYNEVLNGVEGSTPLGFVPGGGTSVLPRALGLPRDPVEAARRIALGHTHLIGVGVVNGRRFGFSCGVGIDAELVRRVDAWGRRRDGKRPGDLAFVTSAVQAVLSHGGRFEPVLELEGLGRATFALVANCTPYTYLGSRGLPLAPRADFGGGLDVVAPERLGRLDAPGFLLAAVRGTLDTRPGVLYGHDLDRLTVRCDVPLPVQVDGEDMGDLEVLDLRAERDAVTVLV
jgi:diacylglycerol kinase family enzyme